MGIELRDYQREAYNDIVKAFRSGVKGVCCVLPCRSGKSYIMAKLIEQVSCQVLVLAHRHTLIAQHKELLNSLGVLTEKVRVESVFTEANRLNQHSPDEVGLIIIDEAHLSEASSYRKVCDYYNARRVLFTATPSRLDGKPLTLAEKLVIGISAEELISRGAIANYDYYAPDLGLDTHSLDVVLGEFNNTQVNELMCQPAIYGDVIKYYNLLGDNRQAISYCASVKHSQQVAEMFNLVGIPAVSIDGGMSLKERTKRMDAFRHGEVRILTNCNIISEGITLPNASVGLLLRPTCSLPLFIQQACRVLTPQEGKRAIIIDFVNNCQRFGLPTEYHEWSLEAPITKAKEVNEDGSFTVRQCENCFRCFKTAPVCPYCGHVYQVKGRELKQMQDVELKKIEEIKREEEEKARKEARMEQGRCKSYAELLELAKKRGYKNPSGWAYFIMKGREWRRFNVGRIT